MKETTLGTIARWAGAGCPTENEMLRITALCRDSRAAKPGDLFCALPGTAFDGHDFIEKAAENGASAALVSREGDYPLPVLRVPDVLAACQAIAGGYKAQFTGLKTVGVTGSAGKTTTTRMTACVLGTKYRLMTTDEDNNGQRGLTFALFGLSDEEELALLEMGMSLPGEMGRLSRMAKPDLAIINGIGTAHIEFFGRRENILSAKLEILEGMAPDAPLILNGDDDLLWAYRGKTGRPILYYSLDNPDCALRGEILSRNGEKTVFRVQYDGQTAQAVLPAVGRHNVLDALAAVGAGLWEGVSLSDACAALAGFTPAHGRENVYTKYGFTILDDCYNASPEALIASLSVLAGLPGARHIAVLGDMLELGAHSAKAHEACGAQAAACCDYLLACGAYAENYVNGAVGAGMEKSRAIALESREKTADALLAVAQRGDAILFKGSHGAHIERVLAAFLEKRKDNIL